MGISEFDIARQVLDRFWVIGINYHKADAATRGLFSVSYVQFEEIARQAKQLNISSLFVVSTCNRTEIYAYTELEHTLVTLLTEHTQGSLDDFYKYGYIKNGEQALDHLFHVAAGLDSQILGDYEILGQIKRAFETSQLQGLIGPVMDRTINYILQASKKIKTDTQLSNGTVSVSFAAIELLKDMPAERHQRILIIGAGKFGTNVCKNIRTYLPHAQVTIINRTDDTAQALAMQAGIQYDRYVNKKQAIKNADTLIVCTNASEHTLTPDLFQEGSKKLILDLSVPANVHPDVMQMPGISCINIDEISAEILDKTLAKRKSEVPEAIRIIESYKNEFIGWLQEYHFSLHLKTWKNKLQDIDLLHTQMCEFYKDRALIDHTERAGHAQKAIKKLAVNLKVKNDKGCQFINFINDYLQASQ